MSLESDNKPHIAKTISYGTILVLASALGTTLITYGQDGEKFENLKKEVTLAKEELQSLKRMSVTKESIHQMLENRDIQIKSLAKKVETLDERMNKKLDRNQTLIIELLQRTPKP